MWSDEPWVVEGAAVRVSIICFGNAAANEGLRLNGIKVEQINTDLTAGTVDLTLARRLRENASIAFMGDTKGGPFDIRGEIARSWLAAPRNPNGRHNSDVLKPWLNGLDITRRPSDTWIIDFGWEMDEKEAARYEAPYQYAQEHIRPIRAKNRREHYAKFWWRHVEPRPGMWRALTGLPRYVATVVVAKHRLFAWIPSGCLPDHRLIIFSRSDDTFIGVLSSRFHEMWSLSKGSTLEDRPAYTPTTTFETFPFPEGMTPNVPAKDYADDSRVIAIAKAAKSLDDLRGAWLNPSDLTLTKPEVVPTTAELKAGAKPIYPDRILPNDALAAETLRKRTLTNLYNQRPQWLVDAHHILDDAVAAAYGWPASISDEDALAELLKLNLSRAATAKFEQAKNIDGDLLDEKG